MSQPNAPEIQRFFETLYPEIEDGWLVLSHPDPSHETRQGKPALVSDWFNLAVTTWPKVADAAAQRSKHHTVYFGVAIQDPSRTPEPHRRGWNTTAYIVPGLWFDLDLAYGHHVASDLPATDQEALDLLHALPAKPSLIIHSGGGLYGYWLFREPYVITSQADRNAIAHLAKRFTHTLITAGNQRGWTLDALGDLARVFRPPGTINHKYGKLVEVIHEGAERYNPSDFDGWLLDLPKPSRATHSGTVIVGQPDLVTIAEHYGTVLEDKSASELAGSHPFHDSSTGDNFNINPSKGVWHCWRHGTGGDALTLIAVCEGWLACENARSGALAGDLFKRAVGVANEKFDAGIALHAQADAAQRVNGHKAESVPLSDTYNAIRLVEEHGQDLRYCHPWKKWLVWTGTHWTIDETGEVSRRCKATIRGMLQWAATITDETQLKAVMAHIKTSLGNQRIKGAIEQAQSEAGIPILPAHINQGHWLLNVQNGTIDLRTGHLKPHDRTDMLMHVLPIPYEPDAPCPRWESFLSEIVAGREDLVAFLKHAVGLSLIGQVLEHVIFIFYGSGQNGKGTFHDTMMALLGGLAHKAPIEMFMRQKSHERHPTERASLFGKRYVVTNEADEGHRLNESLVKDLTGGDAVTARRMHEDEWTFTPTHTLFMATNHKPEIRGTDFAIWRRIKLIPFTVTIPDEKKDERLRDKLKAELPGILRWAVEGCLEYQREGLQEPKDVREATQGYRDEMDVLETFIEECCQIGKGKMANATQLYKAYRQWCESAGEYAVSQTQFGRKMRERGFEKDKQGSILYFGIGIQESSLETVQDSNCITNHTDTDVLTEASGQFGPFPHISGVVKTPRVEPGKPIQTIQTVQTPTSPSDDTTCPHCGRLRALRKLAGSLWGCAFCQREVTR